MIPIAVPEAPEILPGQAVDLTADEYLADPGFLDIDSMLRRDNDLETFEVSRVSRQVVNGWIYEITYQSPSRGRFTYTVYRSFDGYNEVQAAQGVGAPLSVSYNPSQASNQTTTSPASSIPL